MSDVEAIAKKLIPRPTLFFDIEITDHCNLNCKGCDSFAPLAEENYLSIDECEADLIKLSNISRGEVHHINVLGGEPLLHYDVEMFLEIARKYFPVGRINLVTNGILLKKMKKSFWQSCKKYNIVIAITKYPINLDFDWIMEKAREEMVSVCWFGRDRNEYWIHTKIELSGQRNEVESFVNCWNANTCTVIERGKLFPCPRVAKIHHFNKAFKVDIPVSKKDYLIIDDIKTLDEIMVFLSRPIPFCRFCNPKAHCKEKWGISNKEMSEWL